jgi:dCTP deaminase
MRGQVRSITFLEKLDFATRLRDARFVSVLSNLAIIRALDAGQLRIEPRPTPGPEVAGSPFNASSVDLRLAGELRVPKRNLSLTFDLRQGNVAETLDSICESYEMGASGFLLEPHQFVLGRTIEHVALPLGGGLAARIEGRSSFARTGLLIHFTAPTIHAGFEGTITLEIMNLGPIPMTLTPALPICQLVLERVEGPVLEAPSQFHGQSKATGRREC